MKKTKPSVTLILLALFLFILFSSCITTPSKNPSLFDTDPSILSKQYTSVEIKVIKEDFDADPKQYSKEYGKVLVWQYYKLLPGLGAEIAQLSRIADGTNPREAEGLEKMYTFFSQFEIPPDLMEYKDAK